MITRLKKYLQYGNRFCGIEHATIKESDIIYACVLKQSKKELNLDLVFEEKTIENISNKLPKHQHAVLVVNNNKVLSKTIESEQIDTRNLVSKAFPNLNFNDFYFEVLSQKNKHFIALCRKEYVDALIRDYLKQNISIIDISIGNSLVGTIFSFIEENSISSTNAKIRLEDNQIIEILKKPIINEAYNINGLSITSNHLLSFSGALQTVVKNSTTKTNHLEEKKSLFKGYKQDRFFSQFLKIAGIFIFGLLLINFFVFNYYFKAVNELRLISNSNRSTKNQIVKLNKIISKKQKTADDLLKNSGSKSSFYSDRIIESLPKSILLSEFNYQPLLKRIKADKKIEIETNKISISGTSGDSEAFSAWVNLLEGKEWISNVTIIDYGTASSNTSSFKIKIILNNE